MQIQVMQHQFYQGKGRSMYKVEGVANLHIHATWVSDEGRHGGFLELFMSIEIYLSTNVHAKYHVKQFIGQCRMILRS